MDYYGIDVYIFHCSSQQLAIYPTREYIKDRTSIIVYWIENVAVGDDEHSLLHFELVGYKPDPVKTSKLETQFKTDHPLIMEIKRVLNAL